MKWKVSLLSSMHYSRKKTTEEYQSIQSPILQPRSQDLRESIRAWFFGSRVNPMEMGSFLQSLSSQVPSVMKMSIFLKFKSRSSGCIAKVTKRSVFVKYEPGKLKNGHYHEKTRFGQILSSEVVSKVKMWVFAPFEPENGQKCKVELKMPEMLVFSHFGPRNAENDKFEPGKVEMVVFASFEIGNHRKCRVWARRCRKEHFGRVWARKRWDWPKIYILSSEWIGNASLSTPSARHIFPRYWRTKWGDNGARFSKINTNGVGIQV